MPSLRWYQQSCLEAMWREMAQSDTVAQLPTGSGKSHVIAELTRIVAGEYGARVLILAHVKELLEQNRRVLSDHWPDAPSSYWCAGLGQKRARQVTFGSVQSIYDSTWRTGAYDLILVDEAHMIPHRSTGMYRLLIAAQREASPGVRVAGLTATPYRMKTGLLHQGEDALFESLCYEQKIAPLTAEGFLCPLVGRHAESSADMTGAHIRAGEFVSLDEEAAFVAKIRDAVTELLDLAADRSSILVFGATVEHAAKIQAEVNRQAHFLPLMVTGDTPKKDRERAVQRFRSGRDRMLVNVGVYTTGFDAPNVDCIGIMRATRSPGLYVQITGRGLRIDPSKRDCLLLDYGGNIRRHGPLDDISSTAAGREPSEDKPISRACPSCGCEIAIAAMICPHCGHSIEREQRRPDHDTRAETGDPMRGIEEWHAIESVGYRRHEKPGKPPSMRVDYCTGRIVGDWYSEWICFEHGGYAAEKARKWATLRGVSPAPTTVDEALDIDWRRPSQIRVRLAGKFPEITGYRF